MTAQNQVGDFRVNARYKRIRGKSSSKYLLKSLRVTGPGVRQGKLAISCDPKTCFHRNIGTGRYKKVRTGRNSVEFRNINWLIGLYSADLDDGRGRVHVSLTRPGKFGRFISFGPRYVSETSRIQLTDVGCLGKRQKKPGEYQDCTEAENPKLLSGYGLYSMAGIVAREYSPFETVFRMLPNGQAALELRCDTYGSKFIRLWTIGTGTNPGSYLAMQPDGNLVLYSADKQVLWQTGTLGANPYLEIGTNGQLWLSMDPGSGSKIVWTSPATYPYCPL